jgi:hypothetical protein
MTATVTVRDIAERIQGTNENLTNVIDRLRNWTKEGLLAPEGEKHPGTGRTRRYPQAAVAQALLLTVLTEAIGMQATKAHTFAALFDLAKKWLTSEVGQGHLMIIGRSRSGGASEIRVVRSHAVREALEKSLHQVHIVIDLGKVYASLNPPAGETS